MKKIYLIFSFVIAVISIGLAQKPDFTKCKNEKIDSLHNYQPDFVFFDKNKNLFKNEAKNVNSIKGQFSLSQNYYKCYLFYKKKFEQDKSYYATLRRRRKKRKFLPTLQNDSLSMINNRITALNVCIVSYDALDSLLTKKFIALQTNKVKTAVNKGNLQLRNAILDSIFIKVQKLQASISLAKAKYDSLQGEEKFKQAGKLCSLKKQLIGYYYDRITTKTTNDPKTLVALQKKYKAVVTVIPPTPQIVQVVNYTKYLLNPYDPDSFNYNVDLDASKIEKFNQMLREIKLYENLLPQIGDSLDYVGLDAALAHKYFVAYVNLYNAYFPVVTYMKDKINRMYEDAMQLKDLYDQTDSLDYMWQAVMVLAGAVLQQEYSLTQGRVKKLNSSFLDIGLSSSPKTNQVAQPAVSKITKPVTQTAKRQQKTTVAKLCQNQLYQYSINQPNPGLIRESGVVYRIYVGTYAAKLVTKAWKDYLPIAFIKYCNSRLMKFYVGKYSNFSQANLAALQIKKKYHINVQITKFQDGKPIKYYRANAKLAAKSKSQTIQGTIKNILSTNSLVYVIRLGTYSTMKKAGELAYVKKLYYQKLANGQYVYYDGPYYKYDAALAALQQIKALGYPDAYIQAFYNAKHIDLARARKLENPQQTSVFYGVMLGSFSKKLTIAEQNSVFSKIKQYNITYLSQGGRYIYYIPAKDLTLARSIKQQITQKGYSNAQIIKIDSQKVTQIND